MLEKIKSLFQKSAPVDNWYADYRMEDGQTGRVFTLLEVCSVERVACKRGHKSLWWSVNGGDWFDGFKYPGD